jgi:hypothetical protein
MDEVDKAIEVYKPDSWKSYTIGDPLAPSKFPWRLDDEQVMYPFYDKAVKAGITHAVHPQGAAAARLREIVRRRMGVRNRLGHRQGCQGLAADELRDLSLGAASVPRAARPGLGRVRVRPAASGGPPISRKSRRSSASPTSMPSSARLCQLGRGASEVLRRAGRHADQGHGGRSCPVGHRLGLVRLAAVADRGAAPARNPGGHAEEIRFCAARRRQQRDQAADLRRQRHRMYRIRLKAADNAVRTRPALPNTRR